MSQVEDPIRLQLEELLRRLTERIDAAVVARRAEGMLASPTQGLLIKDRDVDRLLAGLRIAEREATSWPPLHVPGADPTPFDLMVERSGLDEVEIETLLVAIAPELDARVSRLYGYLNDDVARCHATVGLTLELIGSSPLDEADRARLAPHGRLARWGLVQLGDADQAAPTRSLTVTDRLVHHILGGAGPDLALQRATCRAVPAPIDGHQTVAAALDAGARAVWVVQAPGHAGISMAATAIESMGRACLAVDLGGAGPETGDLVRIALCEALLTDRILIVTGLQDATTSIVDRGILHDPPVPLVVVADAPPELARDTAPICIVDAGLASAEIRRSVWPRAIDAAGGGVGDVSVDALAEGYRLTPEQIHQASQIVAANAAGRPTSPDTAAFTAAIRSLDNRRFERLARRVEPVVRLDDLVVSAATRAQLDDVIARVRHREQVYVHWGLGRHGRRPGTSCLLSGPSGTGKTLSAEAVAGELGLDLYVIDLSQVVDKYIGETEKNLERIFSSAEGVNAVLLFDEADALFGKRSDVRDAQDRHANVEVAYLLQRMEVFDGVVILSTNLPANVDDAFGRRLDVIIRYELPTVDERRELWRRHLPDTLPLAPDVDLDVLAAAIEASGGVIANVCRGAAFAAAAGARDVEMADLVRAAGREQTKQGRLRNDAGFGVWAAALDPS